MKKVYLLWAVTLIITLFSVPKTLNAQKQFLTKVITPAHFDTSQNLRDVEPIPPGVRKRSWKN